MSARLSVMLDAAPRQLRASAPALATLRSLRCRGRAHRHQLVRQNVSAAARSGSESPGENVVGAASKAAPALLFDVAGSRSTASPRASVAPAPAISPAAALSSPAALAAGGALLAASAATAKLLLDKPSRPYEPGSVGREYDAWTAEGILEYYWGEHIHLGYYTDEERAAGYKKKDFKQSKFDFVDKMLEFSGAPAAPAKVLDVGCGIGGTTRYLARKFGDATSITGITLSPNQVRRGTQLAADKGLGNCSFKVMDALAMEFPDNSFDLVWACESGEHMPDKKRYVEEMVRVLKPGGTLVIATWCQRETTADTPFTAQETDELRFLYEEWSHPYFISVEEYGRLVAGTGVMSNVHLEDWARFTIPAWRHSIWVGVWDPWPVMIRPTVWYKTMRDAWCLERMHRAFDKGLMKYGMIRATKAMTAKTQ